MSYTVEQLRDYTRVDVDEMLDWSASEIERLSAELDVTKQNYVHACESIANKDRMIVDRDKDIERLNQMLRETGQGQGAIDAYVAQCEELDRLRSENRVLWKCVRDPKIEQAAKDAMARGEYQTSEELLNSLRFRGTDASTDQHQA